MTNLELLTNIISGIVESFCVSYLMLVLATIINKSGDKDFKSTKNFINFWLITLLTVIINKTIHIFLPELKWLKFVNYTILSAINYYLCYNIKIYKGLITSVAVLIVTSISEILIVIMLKLFGVSPEQTAANTYYNCLSACVLALFEAFIAFIASKLTKTSSKSEYKLHYFMPQLIATIICIIPTMVLFIINDFKNSETFLLVNIIQLIIVSFVGIFNLYFVVKHEKMELELANTITYNQTLKKVNEGVRGFKHDMGNIVQAILGYIAINDSEGAKQYCQNLVIGFNDINILSILSPKVIDDPAIYGIVVNKILIAREKDMTLTLDVSTNVSEINFPKFELSRILGILLDNAIEAGENTDDKKLIVNIRHDYKVNSDIITISNSINDTNIDVDKIFAKNYSTKENPSGFGLYEVSKFINRHPQSHIETTIDSQNKLFTQKLVIYK